MGTMYIRNVPEEVIGRLRRLAEAEGISLNAIAVRELALSSRRADNPALLAELPDVGVSEIDVVSDLESERAAR